ncbi:MAG: molybdopterin molybdenumtransferase MoeA, partial [Actinobacteria bacterium]|nr:molybdopterin molybdenumtransferase MoeA [Actinomycetota bacterium]
MLSVEAARSRILASLTPCEPIQVRIGEAAGLVLAEDRFASHPLPRFDNSAMDGYAVRSEDVESASDGYPVELKVVGEVRAGAAGDAAIGPGEAVRIMTGAPVPPGADAVVPVEVTSE